MSASSPHKIVAVQVVRGRARVGRCNVWDVVAVDANGTTFETPLLERTAKKVIKTQCNRGADAPLFVIAHTGPRLRYVAKGYARAFRWTWFVGFPKPSRVYE